MAGKRTDLDVWTGHPVLPILEAADRAGLSDREALGKIRAAGCADPPPTQHGQVRTWTVAVVADARQHLRRRAAAAKKAPKLALAPPAPPDPPAAPPPEYDHTAALREVMLEHHRQLSAMSPGAAARWIRSRDGRDGYRRMIGLQLLSQGIQAIEDRAGGNGAKLTEMFVKFGALTEPDEDATVTPADAVADADAAAYAILDLLPAVVGQIGIDAVLAAIGRREHHVSVIQ